MQHSLSIRYIEFNSLHLCFFFMFYVYRNVKRVFIQITYYIKTVLAVWKSFKKTENVNILYIIYMQRYIYIIYTHRRIHRYYIYIYIYIYIYMYISYKYHINIIHIFVHHVPNELAWGHIDFMIANILHPTFFYL